MITSFSVLYVCNYAIQLYFFHKTATSLSGGFQFRIMGFVILYMKFRKYIFLKTENHIDL